MPWRSLRYTHTHTHIQLCISLTANTDVRFVTWLRAFSSASTILCAALTAYIYTYIYMTCIYINIDIHKLTLHMPFTHTQTNTVVNTKWDTKDATCLCQLLVDWLAVGLNLILHIFLLFFFWWNSFYATFFYVSCKFTLPPLWQLSFCIKFFFIFLHTMLAHVKQLSAFWQHCFKTLSLSYTCIRRVDCRHMHLSFGTI